MMRLSVVVVGSTLTAAEHQVIRGPRRGPSAAMRPRRRALLPRQRRLQAGPGGTGAPRRRRSCLPPGARDETAVAVPLICRMPACAVRLQDRWYRWAIAVRGPPSTVAGRPVTPDGRIRHGGPRPSDGRPTPAQPARSRRPHPRGLVPTRADALRRIAAEVSGRHDLDGLFRDVIDEAFTLFGVDQAGLWMYDDSPTPLTRVAQRGLSQEILELVNTLPRDAKTLGMDAIREQQVKVLSGDLAATVPRLRTIYRRAGVRTICYVPIVFRDVPLGLLVLYHLSDYAWTPDETEVARAFADHMATAIGNARLAESTRSMTDRLRAISELASRLNRLQDVEGIAQAIVAGTRSLIDHDTIRVYRVDHETGMCEPIALPGDVHGRHRPRSGAPPRRGRGRVDRLGRGPRRDRPARRRVGGSAGARRPLDRGAGVDADRPDAVRRHGPRGHRRVEGRARPVRCRRRDDPDDLRRLCRAGAGQRHEHGAAAPPAGRARAPARGPATPARGQRTAAVDARAGRRPRPHRRFACGRSCPTTR